MPDEEYMIVGMGDHPRIPDGGRVNYWPLSWDSTSPKHPKMGFNVYPTAHEAVKRSEELEVEDELRGVRVEYDVLPVEKWLEIMESTAYFEELLERGLTEEAADSLDDENIIAQICSAAVKETAADKD